MPLLLTTDALVKSLITAAIRALYSLKVEGALPSPLPSKTLIIANHQSFLDGLVLSTVIPKHALFVVHTTVLHNPMFKAVLSQVPHLAIDTTSPLALKQVLRVIDSGQPVVIFPEGRITTTGSLMKVYEGAAFLAAKSGATVFHIGIDGLLRTPFSRVSHHYQRNMRTSVSLRVNQGQLLDWPEQGAARDKRKKAAEAMRQLMMENTVQAERPRTLYQAFLDARALYGPRRVIAEDILLTVNEATGKEEPAFQTDTYDSLLKKALAIREVLGRHTQPGAAVGVLLPNSNGAVAVVLGLSAGNRIPAMLNYSTGVESLKSALVAARIQTIVTSRLFLKKANLEPVVAAIPEVTFLYAEDLKQEVTALDKVRVVLHLAYPEKSLPAGQAPGDPALILFTSGSESRPKGVVHSHRSLLANAAQLKVMADFTPDDKFMTALPLFHSFGLSAGTLFPLLNGIPVFFYPNPLKFRVLPELTYDRSCTVLFGTSTFLAGYGRFAHPYDFHRVRYVVSGAEKLADSVRQLWMNKFGLRIFEGYGATECAPVISVNTPMAYREKTVGKLVPGMTGVLEPTAGIEKGGVLHVSGPNLMLGYLRYEAPGVIEPPSSSKGNGWYSTGDIVSIDEDGFLSIEGRLKRFAKIGGEMIPLEAVERLVSKTDPTGSHAVVTRPDSAKGEQLVLFTTASSLTRNAIIQAARAEGYTELYIPRKVVQLEKLPMLGALKVDYVCLSKMAIEVV